jgi:hypothetical protein
MKVFLRNTVTRYYYQGSAKWTVKVEEALDLKQTSRAVELVFESRLEDVEVLLCYDDPRYDITLPVTRSPSLA